MLPPGIHQYLVCGVPITAASIDQVLAILAGSRWGEHRTVHFVNTYTLSLVGKDVELRNALQHSLANLPDGWPISGIGRLLRVPGHAGQIPGPDAFEAALDHEPVGALRHALFGATPEILTEMQTVIDRRHPTANIVSSVAPPFGGVDDVLVAETLAPLLSAKPDVVWVGLGTPLQDKVLGAALEHVPATLVAVGAAFDFVAASKRRAPRWIRRLRMEWAWRLLLEPRRLWKRYIFGSLQFLALVAKSRPQRLVH